jgi:hypothetical protein
MIFAAKHRAKELTDFSISFGGNITTQIVTWLYYDVNLSIIGVAMVVHIVVFTNV